MEHMSQRLSRFTLVLGALAAILLAGCADSAARATPSPPATGSAAGTGTSEAAPSTPTRGTPSVTPSSTPATATGTPPPADLRAQRLRIPALGIDAPVQASTIIPDTSTPRPGCPAPPPGQTTLTVPDQGVATPGEPIEGFENKTWIFGHSRWLGQPGVLFGLPNLNIGDEVFVDGLDRRTSTEVTRRRFVVGGLYLTDIDSGGKLVGGETPFETAGTPSVILQTSVREDGPGPWILNQQQVLAKSRNLVEGDLNDPCKYLLLFVFARAS